MERIGKETTMATVIVKKGINNFRYSVYTIGGGFIFNANSMKEIRDWYRHELKDGSIEIKKELGRKE